MVRAMRPTEPACCLSFAVISRIAAPSRTSRINACFSGRWLRGTEFHFPERPENLPSLKPLENWPKFNPRNVR